MYVILLLWLQQMTPTSSACSSPPAKRSLQTLTSTSSPLMASKLYDVTAVHTAIMCQSVCLAEDACLAVMFNKQTQLCSVFTAGNTSYSATDFQVYVMQTKLIEVSVN